MFLSVDRSFSQFTDPFGYTGRLSAKTKHINEGSHGFWAWPKAVKWTTSNRRYDLDITFRESAWYNPSDDCGWNKAARITFIRNNNGNENKIHVGWRSINEQDKLRLSCFFHDGDEPGVTHNFVAHTMDTVYTESKTAVDMFLGHHIISMIIDDKVLGIRKKGWISDTKRSCLQKTFYFGGNCTAPHDMKSYFEDQKYDWAGYGIKFNSQAEMTWNLTEFESDDSFDYCAQKVINGSIKDRNFVQYHTGHPNQEHQKCIIKNGSRITFTAGQQIHLYPGFYAKSGSYFKAIIQEPAKINIYQIPLVFNEQISYGVENAKSLEISLYTDEFLDSLIYGTQSYVSIYTATANIDTILPLENYYVVADFYSGRGSQKRVEGYVTNSLYGVKQNTTGTINLLSGSKRKSTDTTTVNTNNLTFKKPKYGLKNKVINEAIISNEAKSTINIYPNPNNGNFKLSLKNIEFPYDIKCMNQLGKVIYEKHNLSLDNYEIYLKHGTSGVYILQLSTLNKILSKKLIINYYEK